MKEGSTMLRITKRIALLAGAVAGILLLIGVNVSAQSQAYPARTIRFIVPYVPSGGVDFVARTLAEKLSQTFSHPVIVDNRPGGSTNIGTELVARAAPDGYTFLVASVPTSVNMTLFKNLRFNIIKDFIHISLLSTAPNILVVHPSLPVKSVHELIAYAKARPGQLTFGSAGIGTSNHLSGELFKIMAGIDMLHVPYKGGGAAVTELLGGHISMYFATPPSVMSHVQSGKLRALGVTSEKRSASVPDIPTISESGLPGFDQSAWHGLFAPAGTPAPIIAKLSAEVVKVLRMPDVEKRFNSQAVDVIASSPEEFAAFIRQDVAKYERLIKTANIHVE
jgi:tripartite-type tricarboxylate transporter receptor subunit TctC